MKLSFIELHPITTSSEKHPYQQTCELSGEMLADDGDAKRSIWAK